MLPSARSLPEWQWWPGCSQELHWASWVGVRGTSVWANFAAFPDVFGLEVEQSSWDAGVGRGSLTFCIQCWTLERLYIIIMIDGAYLCQSWFWTLCHLHEMPCRLLFTLVYCAQRLLSHFLFCECATEIEPSCFLSKFMVASGETSAPGISRAA